MVPSSPRKKEPYREYKVQQDADDENRHTAEKRSPRFSSG